MRIREAAQRLGVSARTLRHYEAAGLLRAARLENGYRSLSEADVQRATWVRDLIAAGFSTRELRGLIDALDAGSEAPACAIALGNKLDQIDRLMETLGRRRQAVAERLAAQLEAVPAPANARRKQHNGSPEHSGPPLSAARTPR